MNNENYRLHAVIIKKNYDGEHITPQDALYIASNFITNKKRHFLRTTNLSYRVRNIPKTKFIKSSFRTKIINKNISLVFGIIKDEFSNQS